MAIERTLSIIKPDAVERGLIGAIIDRFEKDGLKPVAVRLERLSEAVAGGFYAVHRERPFYRDLVAYMTSGPVVVMVLEGENAILANREIMGATDPAKAAAGTIRRLYAQNIERNSVHGSDAPETARTEIAYFFRATEQHPYEWRR
jgi:nucleoside-diphosphate kinase